MSAGNRGQLADFLRSRRARLTPPTSGCPVSEPGRRRTPGLRREEVAELSGVGVVVRGDRIEQAIIASARPASHCVSRWAPSGTRSPTAWRDIAVGSGARLVEVELVCTNRAAHRRGGPGPARWTSQGLRLPDWEQITSREYEPSDRGHLVPIDTATRTPAEAVAAILAAIPGRAGHVSAHPD